MSTRDGLPPYGRWCDQHGRGECSGQRSKGRGLCHQPAVRGSVPAHCRMHLGGPQARAKANIRAELANWVVGDAHDDPAETLLRLITQSRQRADFYATLLGEAYDAAERLHTAETAGDITAGDDAARDLDTVLQTGGLSALIGKTYSAAGKDGVIFASGEAVRGLAKLEADERDRCANYCRLAIAAGIAERQVKIAEQLAATLQAVLVGALDDVDLTSEQRRAVLTNAGRRLALVADAR